LTKVPKTYIGERTASITNGAGKTNIHMKKTETEAAVK
jgi:hypothetical protein